jgi:hypothetical protein
VANVHLEVQRHVGRGSRRAASRETADVTAPADPPQDTGRPPHIELNKPQDVVHCLLFIIEYSNSDDPRWHEHRRHLNLFFSRDGGLHLLLMLLNAYYNKPAAGRRPGWVFAGLRDRIKMSERGLRMLINDAMAEGLIELLPIKEETDRRFRSYRLSLPVITAWETLMESLGKSIGGVLGEFDAGALANVDYRKWKPEAPAQSQIDTLPPSHRLRRRPRQVKDA